MGISVIHYSLHGDFQGGDCYMSRKVKIGMIQLQSKLGDVKHNVNHAIDKIKEAAEQGAQIVCLPELFATGYDLTQLKEEIIDMSAKNYKYIKDEMSRAAKEHGVYLIAPFGEVRDEPGIVYNSALFFDDEGELLGSFAKSHLWALDRLYFREGTDYPVFDTKYGKVGILICYDAGFPEASRVLMTKGAELVFYPSAWRVEDEDIWDLNMRQRALENVYFSVGVNSYDPSETTKLFGKTKICNPRGKVLEELPKNEEALSVFEIDMDEVQSQRNDISYLRDRKPHHYTAIVQ